MSDPGRRDRLISRARRGFGSVRRSPPAAAAAPDPAPLLERLNPSTLARATAHGVIAHRHLSALGLPVPRLHGVIGRAGGWNASTGRPVLGVEAAARFLGGLAGEIAVRPFAASHGAGARMLRREGSLFADRDGRRREPSAIAAELFADPGSELFLVQEPVAPHERVRGLLAEGELPVARVTTFVSEEGRAEVVHACLMLAAPVEIDLPTGILQVDGARLPDWDAACDLARRAAVLLMPQRSIAWDIALTPGGPVVTGADSRYERIASDRFDAALRAMERAVAREGLA